MSGVIPYANEPYHECQVDIHDHDESTQPSNKFIRSIFETKVQYDSYNHIYNYKYSDRIVEELLLVNVF